MLKESLTAVPARHEAGVATALLPSGAASATSAPLSASQHQLWYLSQFERGVIAYNQPLAWRVQGKLDRRSLARSFSQIVRRHDALRTTFPLVNGAPVQRVAPARDFILREVDLRDHRVEAREARLQEVIAQEARYPFRLDRDSLLRVALLHLEDETHVLVVTVHHTVCDGWSMGVLIRELAHFYKGFFAGESPVLPEIPVQYPEFTLWQGGQMQGDVLAAQLAYWKERLDGLPTLDLPADHPRPAVPTFRGATEYFAFPKGLSDAVKDLSARQEVFLFMTLLAAFQTLCHRYTGQTDIVTGCPVAARRRGNIQASIGVFVNLLALRTDFSGDPTPRELLKQARNTVMGAYQHQDLPFERLVEELRPARDLSRNPLVQVVMDQVDPRWLALNLEGLTTTWLPVDNGTSKFDLTLAWSDTPDGLRGWVEYNSDLFEPATISRMLGHYQTVLEGFACHPDQRVSQLPLLTEAEVYQATVEWNRTEAEIPSPPFIHRLFELQTQRTPEALAVETAAERLTFDELNRRANQLAHYLVAQGVNAGDPVGVCLERSGELAVVLLGILKAGAAYVPLDPAYPRERLAFMLHDSGARVLVTASGLAQSLPTDDVQVVRIDRDRSSIDQESDANPDVQLKPDALAYVIYTSGSTGQPKGVLGLHRGAVNRFAWMWRQYPFVAGERACAKTALSFVDSVWEMFGPMLAGVPTLMIPDSAARDPLRLIAILAAHRVTRIVVVPSLLRTLMDMEPDLHHRLPDVKVWVSSGEALSASLAGRFHHNLPGRTLINLYGSSEVSADVTCYEVAADETAGTVPIGRPIANTQVYVLDGRLQPVPVGVAGEVYVGGAGLASGYLNRPEQTVERFIRNPFSNDPEGRLCRTGDRARYRSDGNLEILGRLDNQVKIRGFRVELEEIESALSRHPEVQQAVVVAHDDSSGEVRLAAYLVPKANAGPAPVTAACRATLDLAAVLRRHLREFMPEHMVPSVFVIRETLPLLPNGKIDRHALPAPDALASRSEFAFAPPASAAERAIAGIWREALHMERVGIDDNFFDLGGHSLLLASIHAKLLDVFPQPISLVELYQYPTISTLATHLSLKDAGRLRLQSIEDRVRRRKAAVQRQREIRAARPV